MSDDDIPEAYQNQQCGMCGDQIRPGVWCDNDDCPLGGEDADPNGTNAESQ